MKDLFRELWMEMIKETDFGEKLKENGLSIFFMIENPEVAMYVDVHGPLFGKVAKAQAPAVTMKMSGDILHKFWLNQINVPESMALRQIRVRGSVIKILQILSLLQLGFAIYPNHCKKYNLPVE